MSKYMELVKWIKEQIFLENLLFGQKVYSENELKDMFGVSRQTVRHAIGILEKEGVVRRIKGSGTYVNDTRYLNQEKRSKVIVVTNYVDTYIFSRTIQGMEYVLSQQGYSVQIVFTNNQNKKEKVVLEDIINRNEVAGVIIETTKSGLPNPNLDLYKELQRRKVPVLFINGFYPALTIPHVSINDRMAGKKATQYLISMGHRRIGGIFKLDDVQGHQRYAGYVEAMNEAGLEVDDLKVLWVDTEDVKNLAKCTERILERIEDCTGLFCYNDYVAVALMEILKEQGMFVSDELSLVSVDNSDLAVRGDVKLSTGPHPMERLGEKAAENLIKMMQDTSFDGTYEFDEDMIERDSVKKIIELDTASQGF